MTREQILQKVKNIVADQLFFPAEDIEEDTTFDEIDTHYTDMNYIIDICEVEFGIEISRNITFKTIKDLSDHIETKLN